MKTLEYAVTNLNGNIESETLFLIEGEVIHKKMDMLYIDKSGRKFIHHKNINVKLKTAPILSNINPINMVKTFVGDV